MVKGQAPFLEMHPSGFPGAEVVGESIFLKFFIPALTDPKVKIQNEVMAKERPQARVVVPKGGGRPFPQFYTPPKTQAWEAHVGEQALLQLRSVDADFTLPIHDKRILASVRFNLTRPVSYPKTVIHAVKKPDIDNLVKAILDGIVAARIIEDDNLITDLVTIKRYADGAHPSGVEVELTCLAL